jgi:hypothetical protein
MTIVRANSSASAQLLLAHLRDANDMAVEVVGADTLRINLLGSYRDESMRMEIHLRLRAWEKAQRAKGIEIRLELEDA